MPLIYHPNLKFQSGNECGWGYSSLWLILNDSKLLPPFSFRIEGLHQPPVNICIPCFISVKEVASGTIWHDNGFKVSALIANIYYQYVKQYNNIKLSSLITLRETCRGEQKVHSSIADSDILPSLQHTLLILLTRPNQTASKHLCCIATNTPHLIH